MQSASTVPLDAIPEAARVQLRQRVGGLIERLIALCDVLDGDCDLEVWDEREVDADFEPFAIGCPDFEP